MSVELSECFQLIVGTNEHYHGHSPPIHLTARMFSLTASSTYEEQLYMTEYKLVYLVPMKSLGSPTELSMSTRWNTYPLRLVRCFLKRSVCVARRCYLPRFSALSTSWTMVETSAMAPFPTKKVR